MLNVMSLTLGAFLVGQVFSGCGTPQSLMPNSAPESKIYLNEGASSESGYANPSANAASEGKIADSGNISFEESISEIEAVKSKKYKKKNRPIAPTVAPVVPPAPVQIYGFCEVLRATRERVYFNPSTSEEACQLTCNSLEASNPFRECSYNGIVFRQTPSAQCLIVGSGGRVHYNAVTQPQPCRDVCSSLEASNPYRTCVWQGLVLRAP